MPSNHGHVFPNPSGHKARCGGPALCTICQQDLVEAKEVVAQKNITQNQELIHFNKFAAQKPETEIDLKDALEQMQRAVAALEVAANNLEIAVLNMNIAMAKAK